MNFHLKLCFGATLYVFAVCAHASPTIELTDGSRIQGDIQSLENGVYTIQTTSIGIVHVAQSNIARIVYSGDVSSTPPVAEKPAARDDALNGEIQQLGANIAKDPATMQSIMSLQSDPQIQAILNDPAIMKAAQDGDYAALMNNPKIQALENNEHVKQLVQQQAH